MQFRAGKKSVTQSEARAQSIARPHIVCLILRCITMLKLLFGFYYDHPLTYGYAVPTLTALSCHLAGRQPISVVESTEDRLLRGTARLLGYSLNLSDTALGPMFEPDKCAIAVTFAEDMLLLGAHLFQLLLCIVVLSLAHYYLLKKKAKKVAMHTNLKVRPGQWQPRTLLYCFDF